MVNVFAAMIQSTDPVENNSTESPGNAALVEEAIIDLDQFLIEDAKLDAEIAPEDEIITNRSRSCWFDFVHINSSGWLLFCFLFSPWFREEVDYNDESNNKNMNCQSNDNINDVDDDGQYHLVSLSLRIWFINNPSNG